MHLKHPQAEFCTNFSLFIKEHFSKLNNAFDFEESLKIVDLACRHNDENASLEDGPPHHFGVRGLVDFSVDSVSDVHVLLLVLNAD